MKQSELALPADTKLTVDILLLISTVAEALAKQIVKNSLSHKEGN